MSANERSNDNTDEFSDHGEDDEDDEDDEMTMFRKGTRRPYKGDLLPFDVSVVSPPPSYLGRFQLDPRTHCGDVLEHDGQQFVVKKVRMQYKYSAGAYKMVKKTIEVKSLARKALESYLERVLRES